MPELMTIALLSVCGGLGAGCRYALDTLVRRHSKSRQPLGTLTINVSGSLILGFVTGIAGVLAASTPLVLIVGTGLLGGYTTFSTASFETVQLLRERAWRPALIAGPGMLVLAVLAAAAGFGLATFVT